MLASKSFSSTNQITKFASTLQKVFILSGSTSSEIQSSLYELSHALESGTLQGITLRALTREAPMLIKIIKEYTQISDDAFAEIAKNGEITSQIIVDSVMGASDQISQMFADMPVTFAQSMSMVGDILIYIFGDIFQNISIQAGTFISNMLNLFITNFTKIANIIAITISIVLIFTSVFVASFLSANQWVLVLIGSLSLLVAAFNTTGINFKQIIGGIAAAFEGAFNFIKSGVAVIWNAFIDVAEVLATVFINPLQLIIRLFKDTFSNVISVLETVAEAIDFLFQTSLADGLESFKKRINSYADNAIDWLKKHTNASDQAKIDAIHERAESMKIQALTPAEIWQKVVNAYNTGYEVGENIEQKISELKNILDQVQTTTPEVPEMPELPDFGDIGDIGNVGSVGKVGSVDKIKTPIEINSEDLKYLQDIAEREAINRFTTAEINIEQINNNQIDSDLDLDGIINKLNLQLEEAISIAREA
jgi:tape measure domain-containing protein